MQFENKNLMMSRPKFLYLLIGT